jgi:hypothetical protein
MATKKTIPDRKTAFSAKAAAVAEDIALAADFNGLFRGALKLIR